MKTWVIGGLLATTLFAAPAVAQQRAPAAANPPHDLWCREANDTGGSWMICSAYTFQQCMASRYSHTETCFMNPRYDERMRRR